MHKLRLTLATAAFIATASPALAATVLDPVGDFLPSYTAAGGLTLPDLDVVSFTVLFNPGTSIFTLGWTLNGAVDPATVGFYVIGVNTGTGTNAPFGGIGAPNVTFNQALLVQKTGVATLAGANVGTANVVGNAMSISLASGLFPSTGLAPANYGWNIWPRGSGTGNAAVTDFAPNNGLLAAVPVPEPGTWGLMLLGFGAVGIALRRARRQALPQLA